MDCRLVFYSARKTSFCERALKKSFLELDLKLLKTSLKCETIYTNHDTQYHDPPPYLFEKHYQARIELLVFAVY